MPTPTFISTQQTAWNTSTTPKTLSVTVAVGDDLVVLGSTPNSPTTLTTPTGGSGFTWTLLGSSVVANNCTVYMWKTTATSAQTFTLSVARAGTSDNFGFCVIRFSGVSGYGTLVSTASGSGAPSQAVTTVEANSTLVMITADWNAVTGTRTYRTVNGFTPAVGGTGEIGGINGDGATYGVSAAYWPDAGSIGSKTVGTTAPTGQKFSILAVEVKGTASGGTAWTADASPSFTFGTTADGTVARVTSSTPSFTFGVSADSTVARSAQASPSFTWSVSADGTVQRFAQASPSFVWAVSADGTVQRFAQTSPTFTFAVSTDGTVARLAQTNPTFTFGVLADATVTHSGKTIDASPSFTWSVSTDGTVQRFAGVSPAFVWAVSASGTVQRFASSTAPFTFGTTAAATRGQSPQATAPFTFTVSADALVQHAGSLRDITLQGHPWPARWDASSQPVRFEALPAIERQFVGTPQPIRFKAHPQPARFDATPEVRQ